MAKKKAAVKRKSKAIVPAVSEAPKTGKKNGGIIIALLAVFIAFVAAEVYFISQKSARESKRPVLIASLEKSYGGITSMGEYGRFIYVTDSERGEVRKVDKSSGKIMQIMEVNDGASNTVADSQDMIYVLSRSNTVIIYSADMKEVKRIVLPGINKAIWIDMDSEDNLYVADDSSGEITKFDRTFNKVLAAGGRGDGKGKFIGLSKMHVALSGDIYAFESTGGNDGRVQVFDKNGKFKMAYKIDRLSKLSGLTNFAVTPDGSVYFNDFEGNCVVVYGSSGKYMGKFDTDTAKSFLVTFPAAIAGGPSGVVYVATHKLAAFSPIKY